MANSFGARQWKIDTQYTYASLPNGHIAQGNVYIRSIVYTSEAVSTAPFAVQDKNGNSLFQGVGPGDQSPVRSFEVGWAEGVQVPVLSAPGVILISIK
jgi:hypothetical protein